jgi:hypothetical protein
MHGSLWTCCCWCCCAADVLRRQSSRWAQQDTSRSTRGGSVSQVYQETQIDEQVRRYVSTAITMLPVLQAKLSD